MSVEAVVNSAEALKSSGLTIGPISPLLPFTPVGPGSPCTNKKVHHHRLRIKLASNHPGSDGRDLD